MRLNRCATVLAVALAAVLASPAAQACNKNFSGEWKMIPDKSDFGPLPAPDKMTRSIQHEDPSLKIATAQTTAEGERKNDSVFSTDGKETTNDFMGSPTKSTAKCDGDNIVIDTKLNFQGTDVTTQQKWTLTDDGKTFTEATHINSPQGEFDLKLVFEKGGSAAPAAPAAPVAPAAPAAKIATTSKADYSGDWKMLVDKSDWGPLPAPEKASQKIEQTGSLLKVSAVQVGAEGERKVDSTFDLDGKETTNQIMGNEAKSTGAWEAGNAVIDTKFNFQGTDVATKQKWQMTPDGKTLTVDTHIVTAQGEFDMKWVFEKQ